MHGEARIFRVALLSPIRLDPLSYDPREHSVADGMSVCLRISRLE